MDGIPKHEMIMMDNIQREFDHQQSLCRQKAYELHRQQQTRLDMLRKKEMLKKRFQRQNSKTGQKAKNRLVDRKRKADKRH